MTRVNTNRIEVRKYLLQQFIYDDDRASNEPNFVKACNMQYYNELRWFVGIRTQLPKFMIDQILYVGCANIDSVSSLPLPASI